MKPIDKLLQDIKKKKKTFKETPVVSIESDPFSSTPEEVLIDKEEIRDNLLQLKRFDEIEKRMKRHKTVDSLLKDFSLDAAKMLILEMYYGKPGRERLNSIQQVLDRVQGKPVEKRMNINHEIEMMPDEALNSKITELLYEIRPTDAGAEGGSLPFFIEQGARQEARPAEELRAEPAGRFSGKVLEESSAGAVGIGGEPKWEDARGGGEARPVRAWDLPVGEGESAEHGDYSNGPNIQGRD